MELYVDVVENLADSLKFNEIVLCGHALGGATALSFYFKHPEKVSVLILIDTGAKLRVSPFILNAVQNNYKEFLDSLPVGIFYRKTSSEIINKYVEQSEKIKSGVVYADFKICDNFDVIDKIPSITIPCLIICGKDDKIAPLKYSMFLNQNINDSKLVVIPKSSHMVMLEQSEQVNKIIEDFLENPL